MSATLSPLDLFQGFSDAQKDELFVFMMRQFAVNVKDQNVVPLWDENTLLGYFVQPKTPEAERICPPQDPGPEYPAMLAKLPAEVAGGSMRQVAEDIDWDDVLTRDELRKIRQEVLSHTPQS